MYDKNILYFRELHGVKEVLIKVDGIPCWRTYSLKDGKDPNFKQDIIDLIRPKLYPWEELILETDCNPEIRTIEGYGK